MTILLSFLAGYITGKKTGIKDGFELGQLYAPMQIRKESLEKGECLICKTTIDCYETTSMIE